MHPRLSMLMVFVLLAAATMVPAAARTDTKRAHRSVQSATVELTENGYEPASLTLRKGVPARVTFIRRVEETCGTAVVVPDFDIRRDLPLDEPVVVEFIPSRAGTFSIACGMNMLRGSIVVR